MEVVRALDSQDYDRVHVDEIIETLTIDVSESSVYKALRNLIDKDLVEKLPGRGYYRYVGPSIP